MDSGALTVNGVPRLPPAGLRGLSPKLDREAGKQETSAMKSQDV